MPGAVARVEEGVDPAEMLRRDVELLAAAAPVSRVTRVTSAFVALGVAQRGQIAVEARARAAGLPVLRRTSGGSGLLHLAEDLVWSVVLPRSDPRVGRDFARAYARLGSAVRDVLGEAGVEAAWAPAAGVAPEYCLLSSRGDVLRVAGRAVGGAAQHLTKEAILHHGTVNISLDRSRLSDLFQIPPPVVERHLTSLAEEAPALDRREFGARLARRLTEWVDG